MGRQRGMARSGAPFLVVAVLLLSGVAARPGGTLEVQGDGASEGKGGADALYKKLADERHTAAAIFRRLDTDKDGSLSKQEMKKHNKLNYAARMGYTMPASTIAVQADENADGRVSKREYAAWYASRVETVRSQAAVRKKADRDESGDLSYEEYKASDLYKRHADAVAGGCPADFNPGPADTLCSRSHALVTSWRRMRSSEWTETTTTKCRKPSIKRTIPLISTGLRIAMATAR